MQFNIVVILCTLLSVLKLVAASPVLANPLARDAELVYRPKIVQESVGTEWRRGSTRTISWDTSNLPKEKKNDTGTLLLGYLEHDNENLDINYPLADNFPLSKGSVTFAVPKHLERKQNYVVALLGDSGNISGPFAVV
ncbi:hypothetical protein L218DRAFT_995567 [Marasmius fiardii PR-910]|nr:hypothetical protein L218DRAFT_995567 [Marasmius fiardii PR-910]